MSPDPALSGASDPLAFSVARLLAHSRSLIAPATSPAVRPSGAVTAERERRNLFHGSDRAEELGGDRCSSFALAERNGSLPPAESCSPPPPWWRSGSV